MSTTTTLPKCREAWCKGCANVGVGLDPYHATETVFINDPEVDADNPNVFATVVVERLDRDGQPGVPRVRIETGDQALSYEAWRMVNAAVEHLYAQIRD